MHNVKASGVVRGERALATEAREMPAGGRKGVAGGGAGNSTADVMYMDVLLHNTCGAVQRAMFWYKSRLTRRHCGGTEHPGGGWHASKA